MTLIASFLRLIRWPNLFFIALTQALFHVCILDTSLHAVSLKPLIEGNTLFMIMASSIFIAAGGNIINDYFDLNIDQINKPDKLVVDRIISRRWVIAWHLIVSFIGIALSFYVDWKIHSHLIGWANLGCVLLLFIYSASLKKKFLVGNILVSLLTAWVILILCLPEFHIITVNNPALIKANNKIFKYGVLYAGFAFILSLVREVVKDMEDIDGDRRYGCKTMPIVWGLNATKVFVAVWLIVLTITMTILQFYVLQFGWWMSCLYCVLLIILPLVWILRKLFDAQTQNDFHTLSSVIKAVMLAGILSMAFIKFYS